MKSLCRFPIDVVDKQFVEMPVGAFPYDVEVQQGKLYVLAYVDTNAQPVLTCAGTGVRLERCLVQMIAEGHPVPDKLALIGTFKTFGGFPLQVQVFMSINERSFGRPN